MIYKDIKIEFSYDYADKIWYFDSKELPKKLRQNSWLASAEKEITFSAFKNNHEVSLSESKKLDSLIFFTDYNDFHKHLLIPDYFKKQILNQATKKLEEVLKIENDCNKDTMRAIHLKNIINAADFKHEKLVPIKLKTSHSAWYKGAGILHDPSSYVTLVPQSVKAEALELQSLRRKHQNDPNFDFFKTSYKTIQLRIADHVNNDTFMTNSDLNLDDIMKNGIMPSQL